MEITVDPYLPLVLFFDFLHQALDSHDLWMEQWLRVDPLSV
jgi:hypothetical protein